MTNVKFQWCLRINKIMYLCSIIFFFIFSQFSEDNEWIRWWKIDLIFYSLYDILRRDIKFTHFDPPFIVYRRRKLLFREFAWTTLWLIWVLSCILFPRILLAIPTTADLIPNRDRYMNLCRLMFAQILNNYLVIYLLDPTDILDTYNVIITFSSCKLI